MVKWLVMVEWIKLARRRGLWADVLHVVFNLLFVTVVVLAVALFPDTPWPALGLVLLAKWRVIAVRPRYWWANILSSLPDALLGFGVVVLMWQASDTAAVTGENAWPVQIGLGVFLALWLIVLKPQTKRTWVLAQSGVSQFVGLTALFSVASMIPLSALVAAAAVVAFAAARQALGLYEEKALSLLSMVWGLAVAELAFAAWHWTVVYQITPLIQIPQIAIIIAAISVVVERTYRGWHGDKKIEWQEVGVPLLFTLAVVALLMFGFGGLW
jgi:hypothetical protein